MMILSELIEKAQEALAEHGDIPVHQWSECDWVWFETMQVKILKIEIDDGDEDDEKGQVAFCLDYT